MDRRQWLTAKPGENRPRVPTRISGLGDASATSVTWAETDKLTGVTSPDVCPGWAGRQPLVAEACAAHTAFAAGELATCFPDPPNILVEAVLELKRAFDDYQRQLMAQLKDKANG